ncbi:FAD-dependent oxidoreductase [bacterium]|nr:FAD-dependent oxidoreductase [bacterium]
MHKDKMSQNEVMEGCWQRPDMPAQVLLETLKVGRLSPRNIGNASLDDVIRNLRRETIERPVVFVGTGTCGLGAGAAKTLGAIRTYIRDKKIDADVVEVGCIGLCSEEPIMDVQLPDCCRVSFGNVSTDCVTRILDGVFAGQIDESQVLGQFRPLTPAFKVWDNVPYLDEHPFLVPQKRWVLALSGIIDPANIDEYIACGGYSALARTLSGMEPMEVCESVEKSGLRGRGGGGFPTGLKWKFARKAVSETKYLICNADEGDPGAFMDRAVAESDPHRLLEGMVIAAYAIGASKAYIYIRAEYPLAIKRLEKAMAQALEYGFLGKNILGSGFNLEIVIKMGAGAFVCGEETALIHSIEGKRGMPRPRPPYPAVEGLFKKPTVINNVETLANVSTVIGRGWENFAALGTEKSKGTKVFALSGMVRRTGLVEVPMGTTLREVVFGAGGGIPNGKRCKAVQIGGPSGGCIPEAHLDLQTDYDALKKFGAIMGSGGLVVMDQNTCMVDLAKYFMEFIQSESCGKCIPCREGTRRMLEILEAITRSRKREEDIDALLRFQGVMALKELGEVIRDSSLCGLGQTAPNPVLSTLRWFRDEYEAHIFDRQCPAGVCKELVGAPCQTGCPVGTEVWRYVAHISRGENQEAYRVIRQANPFPSVCARVCNHPCEDVCRCGTTGGQPIAVRSLKRYVVDHVDPASYVQVMSPNTKSKRVAVIGAGPSGLTAANILSLQGYKVTLFEKEDRAGGMLVQAIPAFRLPRDILSKEIESLLNENIELRLNTVLGKDFTIDGLLGDGYDAVYVSLGAHKSRKLALDGEHSDGVLHGIDFLKAFNLNGTALASGKVGVVGGGNSALDAARVALRQKGVTSVTIFYRRTREEMPAYDEEIQAALEEGVKIEYLVTPVGLKVEQDHIRAMTLCRNQLGKRDASGRRSPVPIPGTEFEVGLDTLIIAISEEPNLDGIEGIDLVKGTVRINQESYSTGKEGIFAGGDVVTGPNTVIDSIAAGKNAAVMIDRYLSGRQMKLIPKVKLPSVYIEPVEVSEDETDVTARPESPTLSVKKRKKNFAEVELCLAAQEAIAESRRCLRCDLEFTKPE